MKALFILMAFAGLFHVSAFAEDCPSHMGTIPDGKTVWGYVSDHAGSPIPGDTRKSICIKQPVTCWGGVLSGADVYPKCIEANNPNCQGLPEGGIITGFMHDFPPCIRKSVMCRNGRMTGTVSFSCHDPLGGDFYDFDSYH